MSHVSAQTGGIIVIGMAISLGSLIIDQHFHGNLSRLFDGLGGYNLPQSAAPLLGLLLFPLPQPGLALGGSEGGYLLHGRCCLSPHHRKVHVGTLAMLLDGCHGCRRLVCIARAVSDGSYLIVIHTNSDHPVAVARRVNCWFIFGHLSSPFDDQNIRHSVT